MPEIPEARTPHDPRVRPLLDMLDKRAKQLDEQAATPKPQRLLSDENAAAVAALLGPVLVNMFATAALRRLTRGLSEAGLPVRELDRREARRIAWPAMALLRIVGAVLRPSRKPTPAADVPTPRVELATLEELRKARQAGRIR